LPLQNNQEKLIVYCLSIENIKMLALGTEAQPINKSIKITQHNMNTLCRYFRHMVERMFPIAV
jgi:hypothetical protein